MPGRPRATDCDTEVMVGLPPEDKGDVLWVGPIGPIPILHDDDPRYDEDRWMWSVARSAAQAMHTADELLAGLSDTDWRVRHEVVDRLIARGRDDPRTLPVLLESVKNDPAWQVRDVIAMRLHDFDSNLVRDVLVQVVDDPHPEVSWSGRYSLFQLGLGPWPEDQPQ